MTTHVSRRRVLATLGAAGVLAPFLPLLEREGVAADGNYPRRLVLLFTPNGTLHESWVPTGTETDFQLGPLLAPLEAFKDKMVVLDGLRVIHEGPGDGHQMGMGALWTGSPLSFGDGGGIGTSGLWADGVSIDQYVADTVGAQTPYRSLEFGVQTGGNAGWSRMSYRAPGSPVAPEDDPQAMFDRLFANLSTDTATLTKLKAERRSVIDLVRGDLESLQSRYGASDRLKVEAHLEAIREIERRNELPLPACTEPTQAFGIDPKANDNFPVICDQMIDQMVMSLACDLTRVASLQFNRAIGDARFTWEGLTQSHHDYSHYGDSDPKMVDSITTINLWYAAKIAELLAKMDAVPEGNGTMLDNSLVVWGNELARGNAHSNSPVPFAVFGSGCGALSTGRFLQYDDVPHNRLLVSLAHLMGVAETQTFGGHDPGTGGLPGLS